MPRRRNPNGLSFLLGLVVLGGGGYLVWKEVEEEEERKRKAKTKKKFTYAIDAQCKALGEENNTLKNRWVAMSILQASADKFGVTITIEEGTDGEPWMTGLDASAPLGDQPGNVTLNADLAQALATDVFRTMVNPKCLETLGADPTVGASTNPFGTDYTEYPGPWPGDTQTYLSLLIMGVEMLLAERGYDVGMMEGTSAVMPSPTRWLLAVA